MQRFVFGSLLGFFTWISLSISTLGADPAVLPIWPGKAPGETGNLGPERDTTGPDGRMVAGQRVIRLTDVSQPTLSIYLPPAGKGTPASLIICPGGGHSILAWDLEGTEVAAWFAERGVTSFVLKYRVPARNPQQRWQAAVQDAQRAVSLVRSRASEWQLDPQRIGILGFSAGGETAGLTALFDERTYPRVDAVDDVSSRPNFAALIYAGGFVDRQELGKLRDYVRVTEKTPPMFFATAGDDVYPVHSSVQLYLALQQAKIPADLHIYSAGGHGFGLRDAGLPTSQWPERCREWMGQQGWLSPRP